MSHCDAYVSGRKGHKFISQHHKSEYHVQVLRYDLLGLFNVRMCHWNSGTEFNNEALYTKVCTFCLY